MIKPSQFLISKASPVRKFVTSLDKSGAILPVLLLEGTVTGGRTFQAYQRDGFVEARERVTEESLGAIFWLFGATMFGKLFSRIGEKFFKVPKNMPAVGRDSVRTPFNNFIKNTASILNLTPEQAQKVKNSLARYSVGKTAASLLTACLFIGYVVPKVNQAITKHIYGKKNNPTQNDNKVTGADKNKLTLVDSKVNFSAKDVSINAVENFKAKGTTEGFFVNSMSKNIVQKSDKPSFGAGADSLLRVVQNFEENAVWKLLGTDVGTVSGRTLNARNNDERVEIMFRDVSSIYFYCFSMPHIVAFMNKKDSLGGLNTKLNPMSAMDVHNKLINRMQRTGMGVQEIVDATGNKKTDLYGKIPLKDFQKFALGEDLNQELYNKIFEPVAKPAPKKVFFGLIDRTPKPGTRIIKLNEFEEKIEKFAPAEQKEKLKDLGRRMAKLMQPEKYFDKEGIKAKILTDVQVEDILRGGYVREPEFMSEVINNIYKSKNNSKPLTDPYKYISQSSLKQKRQQILDYVQAIINDAEKTGEVTAERMLELNKRNMRKNGLFMGLAMGVSALFLSTIIPKIQYYITYKRTGKNSFPGTNGIDK